MEVPPWSTFFYFSHARRAEFSIWNTTYNRLSSAAWRKGFVQPEAFWNMNFQKLLIKWFFYCCDHKRWNRKGQAVNEMEMPIKPTCHGGLPLVICIPHFEIRWNIATVQWCVLRSYQHIYFFAPKWGLTTTILCLWKNILGQITDNVLIIVLGIVISKCKKRI